ncbi:hypothetical protein ACFXJ8_30550 [Nonomuraea sp. NPDC059194]|uniref:hypothetical protein n=1 Tax=Nonomuraea sp. NPDC059194 TaxID=3346764 RepID=UPI00369C354E
MIAAMLVALALSCGLLDGFEIGHVPPGVGEQVSDFSYEWEEVRFASRVWERRLDDGSHRVDLTVLVLRGERLSTPAALRAFLSSYYEGDLADAAYRLVEPGVAVVVKMDGDRFGPGELRATAAGIRPSICSGRREGLPHSRGPSRPG